MMLDFKSSPNLLLAVPHLLLAWLIVPATCESHRVVQTHRTSDFQPVLLPSFDPAARRHSTRARDEQPPPSPKPLVFIYDDSQPFLVKMIWKPTMDIAQITELSQREVSYTWDPLLQGPGPQFAPWRTLVRREDGHDANRRYAFVKDDQCKELDFRIAWEDSSGTPHSDVIQTLQPLPSAQPMNVAIRLDRYELGTTPRTGTGAMVKAYLDWSLDMSRWSRIRIGDATPSVSLQQCKRMFHHTVSEPEVLTGDDSVVQFRVEYITHGCSLKVKIRFPTFDNDTNCYATYENSDEESLVLQPSCEQIPGLDCASLSKKSGQNRVLPGDCPKVDCDPKIMKAPYFELAANETLLFVNSTWMFYGKSDTSPAKNSNNNANSPRYEIRYFHSWLNYNNQPFENENITVESVPLADRSILLPALSVTAQASWVLQVCEVRPTSTCLGPPNLGRMINWDAVPMNPVRYYEMHEILPPWLEGESAGYDDGNEIADGRVDSEDGQDGGILSESGANLNPADYNSILGDSAKRNTGAAPPESGEAEPETVAEGDAGSTATKFQMNALFMATGMLVIFRDWF